MASFQPHLSILDLFVFSSSYIDFTKLDNGVTVASEIMPTNIASISVFIKCGSRN